MRALIQQQERDAARVKAVLTRFRQDSNRCTDNINNGKSVVKSGVVIGPARPFHSVQPQATQIKAVDAESPPVVAEIDVAESGDILVGCGTAVGHNIVPQAVYSDLQQCEAPRAVNEVPLRAPVENVEVPMENVKNAKVSVLVSDLEMTDSSSSGVGGGHTHAKQVDAPTSLEGTTTTVQVC